MAPRRAASWLQILLPDDLALRAYAACGAPGTSAYAPDIANFLVGALLLDDDPALANARHAVDAAISARSTVTPFGIGHPPDPIFGILSARDCPHALEGVSSIWRPADSAQATFFCVHSEARLPAEFWINLNELLGV